MMANSETNDGSSERSVPNWERAHQTLVGLARKRAGLDLEEGTWLLMAARQRVDRRLGFASFLEYVERLFGYAPRLTQEKLRVAEALEKLPELASALANGETSWSSVRELTRVATPGTERAWVDAARGRTARDVERLVSGHVPGSLPTDPADDRLRRHVLRFEMTGEVLATFRDATAKLRRDSGGTLDDDGLLLLMARYVLEGPLDEGRASYQVEISVCEDCQRARQQARGELIDVGAQVVEMARCDAQHLPKAALAGEHEDAGPQVGSDSRPHVDPESGLPTTHVSAETKVRKWAKQDIPPALRREVLRRDQRCCQAPGCRHHRFLDLHHIRMRAEGGEHETDNLVTLCVAHHRAAHDGEIHIEGRVSTGLRFWHADGSEYGAATSVAPDLVQRQTKVFQAPRGARGADRGSLPRGFVGGHPVSSSRGLPPSTRQEQSVSCSRCPSLCASEPTRVGGVTGREQRGACA